MHRLILVLALLIVALLPAPAYAQSAAGSASCGVNEWDGVGFMTKGRTDGMVYSVDHTTRERGCEQTVRIRNLVGTGTDEAYGYPGQESNCQRYGKQDAVNTFRWYFGVQVDPASIQVICSRYSGSD
jgi:hypothetical protein